MLKLDIKISESYNEETNRFLYETKEICLEHSLSAISKWESIWEISFLSTKDKTEEQIISYISCMLLDDDDEELLQYLTTNQIEEIQTYIGRRMTAIPEKKKEKTNKMTVTSESIYYQMFMNYIPIECEHWHIGRLLALIGYFQDKNTPPKKMSEKEMMEWRRKQNRERRKMLKSKG